MNIQRASAALGVFVILTACGGGGGGGASSVPPPGGGWTPAPASSATPGTSSSPIPTAPPTWAPLYSAVNAQVTNFANTIGTQCPSPTYPTKIYDEMPPADSNHLYPVLAAASSGQISQDVTNALQFAAAFQRYLGVSGFRISINYPMFVKNPSNIPSGSGFTTANYTNYESYYSQLITGLHAMGLKVDVETHVIFPQYAGSQYNYSNITMPMLESGMAENATNIIHDLKPDAVELANEPSTITYLTNLPSGGFTASSYAQFVAGVDGQVSNTYPGAVLVGAGTDDWQPGQLTGTDPYITDLIAQNPSLDFYSLHLYPPDHLQDGVSDLAYLAGSDGGKPVIITESWLDKEDVGTDGTTQPIDSQTVAVRDAYSFWESTDANYVASLIQLARCNNVRELDLSYALETFAYVDWNSTSAPWAYSGSSGYDAMSAQLDSNFNAAESAGTLTPAGKVIAKYTGVLP